MIRVLVGCVLLFAVVGSRQTARADNDHPPRTSHAISIEPLGVVLARTIGLEYELGLGHVGLFVGAGVTLGDLTVAAPVARSGTYSAVGFTFGARFYPWTQAPAGPYFGPTASFSRVFADSGMDSVAGSSWSVGAMAGWTWLLGRSFELATGIGAAYFDRGFDAPSSGRASSGVRPLLRLAVGAAF
jgi:hypothetical protein